MKLLLTRPHERVEFLKSQLITLGHDVISYPLFHIIPLRFEPFDETLYDALIITSFYAAKHAHGVDLPIFAVGESLSELLPLAQIFPDVATLKQALSPQSHYLYLRGEKVTDDLENISHDTRIVYKTEAIQAFDQDLTAVDGVIFFSKQTAEIFESLVAQSHLAVNHLEIFTLSPAIASHLTLQYKAVHTSKVSTLRGVLDLFSTHSLD